MTSTCEAAQHRQLSRISHPHISLFPLSSTISTLPTNYEARLCCSSCHLGRCLPDQLFCSQGFGSSPRDQGACQKFPATIDLCSRQSQYVGIFLAMRGGLHAQQSCTAILLDAFTAKNGGIRRTNLAIVFWSLRLCICTFFVGAIF